MNLVSEAIEQYVLGHSHVPGEWLQKLECKTREAMAMPQMLVGPLEGAFLRMLVQLTNAKRVLEIGTFTGYSALAMAEGLPPDGQLITCDIDREATALAREFWLRSPHGHKIQLKLGKALDSLAKLPGKFDLVFIDADKENYLAYWEWAVPRVPSNGLIVVDNVLWSGRVLNPQEPTDHAIHLFNEKVMQDRRVEIVMLPVRDGVTLARKK